MNVPDGVRTDRGPPMAIPFQYFVVALGFLVAGAVGGVLSSLAALPGLGSPAYAHLLLVGWICLTIMGAMTQFVPVWSGVELHSRRLTTVQLWLVAGGLVGFVASLLALALEVLPVFAALMLAGIWLFVYNVGRTLLSARPFDFTERHFAVAFASFAALAALGFVLALDFALPVLDPIALDRGDVRGAHVTLAVFGAVTATVVGAIAQLGTMFTQTGSDPLYRGLEGLEQATFPLGLVLLALGRGAGSTTVATVGAVGVLVGLLAVALVLVRRLAASSTDASPMTDRYWIVAAALFAWIGLAAPAWLLDPIGPERVLGYPDATALLVFGVFGFVVVGTLYHVVPFIIWIERYSDRVGLEPVPMIDDLYSHRLERADLAATGLGAAGLVVGEFLGLATPVVAASAAALGVGFCLFVSNMLLTVHRHDPNGLGHVLRPRLDPAKSAVAEGADAPEPDRDRN
ncbi:cbb3-type cytochrome c oxidase subunit I [Natronococcus sp. JC468]|uniref:cbb3-type cytochrome c oxidase subunit I n=1 Tax=Natronococcus sp. JC468 TaxID=1961921 RepID=UPI001438D4A4|nr:cbb3-type cytochrome c oxidase subunit I [Natronococcus sp. JC468]NKE35293.1 cbb3-type cytochrome c oxidase subunit I [Natronococcus sp. JC468]